MRNKRAREIRKAATGYAKANGVKDIHRLYQEMKEQYKKTGFRRD